MKKKKTPKQRERIFAQVTLEQRQKLEQIAQLEARTLSNVVRVALTRYLDQYEQKAS